MQLFTIGLQELNQDGTSKLNSQGEAIQTYWPVHIQNYAAALTGWYFADLEPYRFGSTFHSVEHSQRVLPMTAYEDYHETRQKKLLRNFYIPAGTPAEEALEIVLDSLFYHPNLAPFVSRHLIKAFVTSNPSPAYVGRVSAVFNRNEKGERGNLGSVIQAVLFDPEARLPRSAQPAEYGRAKDPLLRFVNFFRFFKVASYGESRSYLESGPSQSFLKAPNVFNFFSPTHIPNAAFAERGLVAPELQIITTGTLVKDSSLYAWTQSRGGVERGFAPNTTEEEKRGVIYYDFDALFELVNSSGTRATVDYLDTYLTQSGLNIATKEALVARFEPEFSQAFGSSWDDPDEQLNFIEMNLSRLIYQILISPEFLVQR